MNKEKKVTLLFCIEFICVVVSYFIIQGERAEGGTGLFTPSASTPLIIVAGIIFLVNLKYFTKHLGNALTKKQFSRHVLLFSLASLFVPIIGLAVIYYAGMAIPS